MMQKRHRILLSIAVFLSVLAPAASAEEPPIFVATDIHYLAPELRDKGQAFRSMVTNGDGKDTAHGDAILDALAYELPKPSILLVTGDLSLNGEEASHLALARRFAALRKSGVRVFVIPGNHDLDNPWASSLIGAARRPAASVSARRFREIYKDCGYSAASSSDESSLSYYVELDGGLSLLMLDSTRHDRNLDQGYPSSGGRLSEATLRWVEGCLQNARAQGRRVIVAMHHSLLGHNSMLGASYTLENADQLIPILQRYGQRFALTGHIHIQSIARLEADEGGIADIATGSLAVYPHNYGRLSFDADRGGISYRSSRLDIASWAKATNVKDPYLERFPESSAEYFGGFAKRLVDKFGLTDGLSRAELGQLLDFMAELNRRFFAGAIDAEERGKLMASAGYGAAAKLRGSFLAAYVESVLEPSEIDNNRLELGLAASRLTSRGGAAAP